MGDDYWSNQQPPPSYQSATSLKRNRTDFDLPPIGVNFTSEILCQNHDLDGSRPIKDTKSIGSAYDNYLHSSQLHSEEGSQYSQMGLGNAAGRVMPAFHLQDHLAIKHLEDVGPELAPNDKRHCSMQESCHIPPPSAENIPLQMDVDGFPMDDNNTSAGDTETPRKETGRFEDLKGKMFSKAMEEQGCQLLLQKLQERKLEDIQMIFSELKDYICKLMFNRFGSDVILKLFEVCDEEQKNQLVSSVTADARLLISVCIDPQGSETMQKFLGFHIEQKQIYRIMLFFSYFAVPLANHPSGSQVLGQCFKIFPVPAEETQPILDTITQFCLELAVDENGSNLLKILLSEHWSGVLSIVESILTNFEIYHLAMDEFGSSLIQHLIGLLKPDRLRELADEMKAILIPLSSDKYGAEVVKKLIVASRAKYAPQIISVMIKDPELLEAISDPCGFSLLKSVKKYAKGTDRKTLNDLIHRYSQPQ